MIVTVPAILAVTLPLESTVATFLSDELQVILPVAPVSVAFNVSVLPQMMLSELLFKERTTEDADVGTGVVPESDGAFVGTGVGVAVTGIAVHFA